MIGANKFFPSALKHVGDNYDKYGSMIEDEENTGCIEFMEDNMILYYLPVE